MSDIAILDDDERDYHSPFDLALNPAALETFKWLVLGHVLYVVGLFVTAYLNIDYRSVWITPLFGLPFVWRERNHRGAVKALVLMGGVTLMHYVATKTAVAVSDETGFVRGLVGGAIGGGGSLLLCAIFGLLRKGSSLTFEAFGTVLLAAVGSFCVYLFLTTGGAASDTPIGDTLQALKIYTPWQIVFAYVLARVLRPLS
jgi:hypothetical protein